MTDVMTHIKDHMDIVRLRQENHSGAVAVISQIPADITLLLVLMGDLCEEIERLQDELQNGRIFPDE
jgi:hypothetical protein